MATPRRFNVNVQKVRILKGVTRDAVMELAAEAGLAVREEPLNRYDVYTADEAFFTGTASEIAPIREVDGRQVGAFFAAVQAALEEV